jgi:hypothetical protein
LEALQAASFVPHAHRLRHYGAYFLDRPQDNNYLLVHRRFHDWRYFIKRRRAWEAFVSQQHVEFNNALKRRALVVWRARGRVCWASGLTAPGFDYAAYMATKPSAGATSTNLRPPNFSMTGTFSRSAGGTMYDAASSVGDVASYIRGGNAGAMTSLSITAAGTFNTTFEATGTRGWLRVCCPCGDGPGDRKHDVGQHGRPLCGHERRPRAGPSPIPAEDAAALRAVAVPRLRPAAAQRPPVVPRRTHELRQSTRCGGRPAAV